MNAIVIVATKHGSTLGIGEAIAASLTKQGIDTDLKKIDEGFMLEHYDAVIIGSAVYAGHWLPEARRFIEYHGNALFNRPVWLFSSGPLGEDATGGISDKMVDTLLEETGARGHHVFSGALDPNDLGAMSKLVTKIVHAPSGDFRDWDEITAWSESIAASLATPAAT